MKRIYTIGKLAIVGLAIGISQMDLNASQPPAVEQDRVKAAYEEAGPRVRELVQDAGLVYPAKRIFIRAFKAENELEIWGSNSGEKPMKLIHTYKIARASGTLGPKRRQGDLQVPEGFYHVDRFNPKSLFHLSLGLNYPNTSDRILSDKEKPGADIFIHGNQVSIGCMAMTDEKIKEIYLMALGARDQGQTKIPVHIFPFRMTTGTMAKYGQSYADDPIMIAFWSDLKPIYDKFQKSKRVPQVKVDAKGRYRLASK
ncbi:MAG: L,D-transpeptidase family protein [Chlorobia bacterium]|nr:L,D-transpeptidase family protein [Fimbriimonadaceae bacterium]